MYQSHRSHSSIIRMSIIAVIQSTLMTVAFALKEATARQAHVALKINLIAILPFLFLYSCNHQYYGKINHTKKLRTHVEIKISDEYDNLEGTLIYKKLRNIRIS